MKYTIILAIALLMGGCSKHKAHEERYDGEKKIPILECIDETPTAKTLILPGDILIENADNTEVLIQHDSLGLKTVCVISGDAVLVRGRISKDPIIPGKPETPETPKVPWKH